MLNLILTINLNQVLNRRLYKASIPELGMSTVGTTAEEALGSLANNLGGLCYSIEQGRVNGKTLDLEELAKELRQ